MYLNASKYMSPREPTVPLEASMFTALGRTQKRKLSRKPIQKRKRKQIVHHRPSHWLRLAFRYCFFS